MAMKIDDVSRPRGLDAGTTARAQRVFVSAPTVVTPQGAGALRGIAEKLRANAATGTASATVPIATGAGRSGFGQQLALTSDSESGNGLFARGWSLTLVAITRRTAQGLSAYDDTDVFQLSVLEDSVPLFVDVERNLGGGAR